MLTVPGTKVAFRYSREFGITCSWDGGLMWHFTHHTESDIREMWPTVVGQLIETPDSGSEDEDREIFGDTLDEPILDEFWEMI